MKEPKDPIQYTPEEDNSRRGGMIHVPSYEKLCAEGMIKDAEDRPAQLMDLAERTKVARAALLEAIHGIGDAVETFTPKSNEYIRELRSFTACGVLELKNLMRGFEDIRKFFLSNDHQEEIKRLSEFVALCERLQHLKQSGFLDTVADTILRLEYNETHE